MPTKPILALVATLLVILAARFYFVETFAIPLPYWDQWDAEGDFLLRSWLEGRLEFKSLWQPHNEHRIFPTRLLSLLIFSIYGVWDNLIEARINILLAACIPLIILLFLIRQNALNVVRWLMIIAVIAQFALPFSYENLLVGFQSQFYFLIIFTLLAFILAACYADSLAAMAGITVLSLLSVLTMASGILTPLAAVGVYALRALARRELNKVHGVLAVVLLALFAAGYAIMPHIEANQIYRSRSLSELVNALGYILAWPSSHRWGAAAVLWLPALGMVPWLLWTRRLTPADLVMAGCVMWSLMQAVAIAYGRGQTMTTVSSRYTELFTIGLIGNAWFSARFMEGQHALRWAGIVFFLVFLEGHVVRYEEDMDDIRRNYQISLKQQRNVRQYLETGDPKALDQPKFEIPYPDPVRLKSLLDDPVLRNILPESMHVKSKIPPLDN